jgi:DNA polymerase-3 subunit chi
MTQVDFYILDEDTGENRQHYACRLTDKAYRQGRKVYIHTNSPGETQILDRLLWTFRDQSFVPHGISGSADLETTPVIIGDQEPPQQADDVLINLSPLVPSFFSRFQRVAEIVDQQEEVKRSSREHYQFYRDRGYPLNTHGKKK